jgi:hypothetical protein
MRGLHSAAGPQFVSHFCSPHSCSKHKCAAASHVPEEVVERAEVREAEELAGDGGQEGQVAAVREAHQQDTRVQRAQI